jgi:hypothetical protein
MLLECWPSGVRNYGTVEKVLIEQLHILKIVVILFESTKNCKIRRRTVIYTNDTYIQATHSSLLAPVYKGQRANIFRAGN